MFLFMKCARNYLKEIKPRRLKYETGIQGTVLVLSISSVKLQGFRSLLSSVPPTLGKQFH